MSSSDSKNIQSWWQNFREGYLHQLLSRLSVSFKQRNFRRLLSYILTLIGLVTSFAVIFQVLMTYEGQQHSVVTGFY